MATGEGVIDSQQLLGKLHRAELDLVDLRRILEYEGSVLIEVIVCPDGISNKLESKHNVTCQEARQILLSKPRIRFAETGHT